MTPQVTFFLGSSWLITGLCEVSLHVSVCWGCNFNAPCFATRAPLVAPLTPNVTSCLLGTFLPPVQRVERKACGENKVILHTDAVQTRFWFRRRWRQRKLSLFISWLKTGCNFAFVSLDQKTELRDSSACIWELTCSFHSLSPFHLSTICSNTTAELTVP